MDMNDMVMWRTFTLRPVFLDYLANMHKLNGTFVYPGYLSKSIPVDTM